MNKLSNPKLSTMLAAATGAALVTLAVVGSLYSTGIVSVPVFGGSFVQATQSGQASSLTNAATGAGAAQNRAPLNSYANGVRNDLFRTAEVPESNKVVSSPFSPVVSAPAAEAPNVSAPTANGSTWMYTGTVAVGSKHYAVVENAQTHSGRFLQTGDRFGEGKVKAFSPEAVTLVMRGRTEHLYKNRNYSLIPLNSNAPYMKVAASTAQPAATAAKPGQANQANAATTTATPAQTTVSAGQMQAQTTPLTSSSVQLEAGYVPPVATPSNTPGIDVQRVAPATQPVATPAIEIQTGYAPTRAYETRPNVAYPYGEFVNVRPGWMGIGPGRGR